MNRRDFLKATGGTIVAVGSGAYAFRFMTQTNTRFRHAGLPEGQTQKLYGMVIDLTKCEPGCTACMDACRRENNIAEPGAEENHERWDIHWIRKVRMESGVGEVHREREIPLLCNHCDNPPCAQVCPVQATYKRHDGIVIVDQHRCIGCRYCMIACPYNARYFNFKDHHADWTNPDHPKRSHGVAEACNLCAHRLDVGQKPACVEACEQIGCGAIMVGDLNNPTEGELHNPEDLVSRFIAENPVQRIRDDLGTEPKVYYYGL